MAESEPEIPPDPRMSMFVGGFDANGRPYPMTLARLRSSAAEWPVTATTPEGDAALLETGRDLYVHSFFVYEFLTVGVLLSLQAVETSLKTRLNRQRRSFESLINEGASAGYFDADTAEQLHAARKLRNLFSHPEGQTVWTYGMSVPVLAASHRTVAHLFPGA